MTTAKTAEEWLLKEDAAKLLGVNIRSVEKRARKGEIEFRYLPRMPKERQARVVYRRASIEAILRGEVVTEMVPRHPVTKRPLGETQPHASNGLVLAKSVEAQNDFFGGLAVHLAKLSAAFPPPRKEWPLLLTFDQGVEYLNAPPAMLEKLIRDGDIPVLWGRGRGTWRVSRASLDEYGQAGA